jgi:hypothetical protein
VKIAREIEGSDEAPGPQSVKLPNHASSRLVKSLLDLSLKAHRAAIFDVDQVYLKLILLFRRSGLTS